MRRRPKISVIVPSLRDGIHLRNLSSLRKDPEIEVIAVEAERVGRANRAYQMNLGACQARAETLVFLHVDTKILPQDLWIIHRRLQRDRTIVGGAFRFALDSGRFQARMVELGVLLRELVFRLPYGDQAIFVRRSVFEEMGGYPDVPLLEDVLLVQKMKFRGRLYLSPAKAVTSARRWENHGYLKTTLANWATMIFWKIGVSLEAIQGFRERVFA